MALTSEAVDKVFRNCLYRDEELPAKGQPEGLVEVVGVVLHIGFHPGRLEYYRPQVVALLEELPVEFFPKDSRKGAGGGWSFLQACTDRNGVLWTGEHRTVDQLLCLGLGLGLAEILLPRDLWNILPGGMPYFEVKL